MDIKVNRTEFNAAGSGHYVYGVYRKDIHVRIDLGEEKDYWKRKGDDPKTEYRYFENCDVEIANTETDIKAGSSKMVLPNIAVIIYC